MEKGKTHSSTDYVFPLVCEKSKPAEFSCTMKSSHSTAARRFQILPGILIMNRGKVENEADQF